MASSSSSVGASMHAKVLVLRDRFDDMARKGRANNPGFEDKKGLLETNGLIENAKGKEGFAAVLNEGLRQAVAAMQPRTGEICLQNGADPNYKPQPQAAPLLYVYADMISGVRPWNSRPGGFVADPDFLRDSASLFSQLLEKGADVCAQFEGYQNVTPFLRFAELGLFNELQMMVHSMGLKGKAMTSRLATQVFHDLCAGFYRRVRNMPRLFKKAADLEHFDKSAKVVLGMFFKALPRAARPELDAGAGQAYSVLGIPALHALCCANLFVAASDLYHSHYGMSSERYSTGPRFTESRARKGAVHMATVEGDPLAGLPVASLIVPEDFDGGMETTARWTDNNGLGRMLTSERMNDTRNYNVLDSWAMTHHKYMTRALCKRAFDFMCDELDNEATEQTFRCAAYGDNPKIVEHLLMYRRPDDFEITAPGPESRTALHWNMWWREPFKDLFRDPPKEKSPGLSDEDEDDDSEEDERKKRKKDKGKGKGKADSESDEEEEEEEEEESQDPDRMATMLEMFTAADPNQTKAFDFRGRTVGHMLAANALVPASSKESTTKYKKLDREILDYMGRAPMHYFMLSTPTASEISRMYSSETGYEVTEWNERYKHYSLMPIYDRVGFTAMHMFVMGAPDYPLLYGKPPVEAAHENERPKELYEGVLRSLIFLGQIQGADPISAPVPSDDTEVWQRRIKNSGSVIPEDMVYDVKDYPRCVRPLHLAAAQDNGMICLSLLLMAARMFPDEEGNFTLPFDAYPGPTYDKRLTAVTKLVLGALDKPSIEDAFAGLTKDELGHAHSVLTRQDGRGNRAVHYAAASGSECALRVLIECERTICDRLGYRTFMGACRGHGGSRPIDFARRYKNHRAVAFLANYKPERKDDPEPQPYVIRNRSYGNDLFRQKLPSYLMGIV